MIVGMSIEEVVHGLAKVLSQKSTSQKQQTGVPLNPTQTKVVVKGSASVGQVYRLPDGSLVYVKNK